MVTGPRLSQHTFDHIRRVICKSCGSDDQSKFTAEMAIHFPGLKGIRKPHVRIFPEVLICLNCGNAEFTIPETELCLLTADDTTAADDSQPVRNNVSMTHHE